MRTIATLFFVLCACAPSKPSAAAAPQQSYIRSMSLPNSAEALIECDTGRWHGLIKIAADVKVGYRATTVTTSSGIDGNATKTSITVNEREMVIEETSLRIGTTTVGPLSGDVHVDIRSDGVFVDGVKKSDL